MTEMLLGQSSPRRLDPWGRRCWRDSVGGGAVAQIGWRRSELSASYLATGVWVRFASRAARGVSMGSLSGWRSAFVYASAGACTTGGTKPGYDLGWEAEASLDLQWAHAMAPHATIYVVEAPQTAPPIYLPQSPWPANAWPRTGAAKCR